MSRRPAIVIADLDPNVTELTDEQLDLVVGGLDTQDPPDTGYLCTATSQGGDSEDCWRA